MKHLFCLLLFFVAFCCRAQKKNSNVQLHIRKTTGHITVDGSMDDSAWQQAETARNFFMVLPMDTSRAHVRTEVKMTYDDENFYIIAICWLPKKRPYMVESLRRDFSFVKNDNFIFFLDPFNDLTSGYTFGANAAGAQWDGMLFEGGRADLNWDNKWVSVVKNYDDKWIFEAAIPFKTIRYKKGISQWGVNFSRLDITSPEKSAWAPVPRQFPTASLAYTGELIWDQPPPSPGLNFSLIPYALTGISKDYDAKSKPSYKKEIGADAKMSLTSSLNLDLTVNPDYSQVEVDKQVTNLSRYELFFPEKRQFFLENNDLFANFGFATIRPFFSRRIGLSVPISFGARLSGNIDKNWRIGVMDMQTKRQDSVSLPAQNFSVIALQRKIFARSNIRLIFINKQSLDYQPGKDSTRPQYTLYNRNIGAEYNLASSNNQWTGKFMVLRSFSPGTHDKSLTHAASLQYSIRHWLLLWQHEYVEKNYSAEVGYVPRTNYIKLNPNAAHLFFPKSGIVLSHGPRYTGTFYYNTSFKKKDYENILLYIFNLRDQGVFDVWAGNDYVQLLLPFDPTNSNKDTLATGTIHRWKAVGVEYYSKPQKLFTYNITTRFGGYYDNGTRNNINVDLGYRIQPYAGITLSTAYNNIKLPQPWGNTTFWLIGPRIDITFTNKLFLTTFIQYNNQEKNINVNARLQWRYHPASDLFLVYTDNYYSYPIFVRNRAFVLKFTYWWNN
ncbi:MAG TPA: DUF5916 domain-containing protein [Chitinophagaceae bacterium]|nr:DUF5916 domain-containing protein [Chitinophagaceae bacterium]